MLDLFLGGLCLLMTAGVIRKGLWRQRMEFLTFVAAVVGGAAVFALVMGGVVKLLHDYQAREK
jgi:hypothetical protein